MAVPPCKTPTVFASPRKHEDGDAKEVAPVPSTIDHVVSCRYCLNRFELFDAAWCRHREIAPSKICPHCLLCLCRHPAYQDPLLWKEAPEGYRRRGFRMLFVFYL